MRFLLLCSVILFVTICARATEAADSTLNAAVDSVASSIKLKEVAVEGRTSYTIEDGIAYIPSKLVKKTSMDPIEMIKKMAISNIKFDYRTNEVSDYLGSTAAFFIDGRPAGAGDVSTLLPKDVERVQILQNPADPKYMNSKLVVEYITRQYTYGGYVIAQGSQSLLVNSGQYGLFGKLVKGKSLFLVNGQFGYSAYSNKNMSITEESFDLPRNDGTGNLEISRKSVVDGDCLKQISPGLSAKWRYNKTDKIWFELIGGVSFNDMPRANSSGYNIDGKDEPWVDFHRFSKNNSTRPYVSGRYVHTSGEYAQLAIDLGFNADVTDQSSQYITPAADIYNHSRENGYGGKLRVLYWRLLKHNNSITGTVNVRETFTRVKYDGNTKALRHTHQGQYSPAINYWQGFNLSKCRLSYSLEAGLEVVTTHVEGLDDDTSLLPTGYASINASFDKHSLSVAFSTAQYPASISNRNSLIVQETDISASTGSPNPRRMSQYCAALSYTWLPSNRFNMTAAVNYQHSVHQPYTAYGVIDNLITSYQCYSGLFSRIEGSLSGSLTLLNNALGISPSFDFGRRYRNGDLHRDYWYVRGGISIFYMHRCGFSASARYSTPWGKEYWGGSNVSDSRQHQLHLSASYVYGNFSASLAVSPLYRDYRSTNTTTLPGVYINRETISELSGRSVSISLKYVIDFGRKYPHQQDLSVEGGRVSSIATD